MRKFCYWFWVSIELVLGLCASPFLLLIALIEYIKE